MPAVQPPDAGDPGQRPSAAFPRARSAYPGERHTPSPEPPDAAPPPGTRPTRLTGRAALLAVVVCAIALSLAYPVREYIAQRQQIDQLLAQRQTMSEQVRALQQEATALGQPSYIEQQAEGQLHMCFPNEQCYEVISGSTPSASTPPKPAQSPWYAKLWQSVQRANQEPGR